VLAASGISRDSVVHLLLGLLLGLLLQPLHCCDTAACNLVRLLTTDSVEI
jgi:hypothetical protein